MANKHHSGKQTASGGVRRKHGQGQKRKSEGTLHTSTLVWIGVGIVVIAAAAFLLLRPQQTLPTEITATQAYEKYQAGAFFLDVRTQEEWNQGHIENSTLIPLDELPQRLHEIPRDQDVVVVCRSGSRSKEGAAILRQAGFTRVTCMTGGLLAWSAQGYPVQQ